VPRYDQRCTGCDWNAEIVARPGEHPACPQCASATERVWRKAPDISGDETEIVTEHGFKQPMRFTSKAEWKRAMKEAGIRPYDKFTPMPGTDRPRRGGITKSLPPMDAEYQAWLADRLATGKATKEPTLEKLNVRAEVRELTAAEYSEARKHV
jgi:hypothetical protein